MSYITKSTILGRKAGLMATAATMLVVATSAYADGHTAAFMELEFDNAQNVNASDLIGSRVYASEADISNEPLAADGEKEWDDIGEIDEIVLSRSGDVTSVVVGVGGFLGLGEKSVAVDMSQLQFISDGEDADEYFIVIKASAAGVQEAPEYMADADDMASDEMAREDRPFLTAPTIDRPGFEVVEMSQLTTEMLTGAYVYGSNDENIGEIGSLLLTDIANCPTSPYRSAHHTSFTAPRGPK